MGLFVACVILPLATAVAPGGLTQPGALVDCILWYSAKEGDTANTIAAAHNIPLSTFMDANPQLSGDPLALWQGYNYCVPQGQKTPPIKGSDNYYPIGNSTSGNPTAGSGTGLIGEGYSYTDGIDSTSEESGETTKGPQSPQTVTEPQSTPGSEPGILSQPTTSLESSKPSQSKTATQVSDTSNKSESIYVSTTQTTTTNTAQATSTTVLAIPAPTEYEDGPDSRTQSETQSETQNASNEGSGALEERFGAARIDLDEARRRVGGKLNGREAGRDLDEARQRVGGKLGNREAGRGLDEARQRVGGKLGNREERDLDEARRRVGGKLNREGRDLDEARQRVGGKLGNKEG